MAEFSLNSINFFNKIAESYSIRTNEADAETSIFDIFKNADKDNNGVIEGSEVTDLYEYLGYSETNYSELNSLIEEYNKLSEELLSETQAENINLSAIKNNSGTGSTTNPNNNTQNIDNSGSQKPTNTNNNKDKDPNKNDTDIQDESNKNYENMTLDEVKAEKISKENDVKKAENLVSAVFSGGNEAVKAAITERENAKSIYDELLEREEIQEAIGEELGNRREANLENIKNQEKTINITKNNINLKENEISSENMNLKSSENNLKALQSALSTYSATSDDDEKNKENSQKKEALKRQIEEEEKNIKETKEKIKKLESEKKELKEELVPQENELKTLESERTEIDKDIMNACQTVEPELKSAIQQAQQDYNSANTNVDKVKTEEETKAKETLKVARDNLENVNNAYEEKNARKIKGEYGYKNSEMTDLVNYFGEDYLSVLSQEEINELIKKAKSNQMANIYPGKGSQCLGICYEYEKWATGLSGKNNAFESEDVDTAIEKMAEVLNSGSPVIAKVDTKAGHRHFVMVIGIKQGATSPYKQSDFLCVDSYDGQVDGMGGSGNVEGNYRTLYAQNGKYWIGSRATTFTA